MTIDDALKSLGELYGEFPGIKRPWESASLCCGRFCFAEFLFLLNHLLATRTREELSALVSGSSGDDLALAMECGPESGADAEFAERLGALEREFHDPDAEPYYLDGLNLASWFAVLFDGGITQAPLLRLRDMIIAWRDVSFLGPHYVNRTGLKEMLDLVDAVAEAEAMGRFRQAEGFVKRILRGFPRAGGYYAAQGEILLGEYHELFIDND